MKLTESRIKEIILEEIEALSEQEQPQEKTQSDVANIVKLMPKIDNVKEYGELITLISKHDFGNDQQKIVVLKKLRDLINTLVK